MGCSRVLLQTYVASEPCWHHMWHMSLVLNVYTGDMAVQGSSGHR